MAFCGPEDILAFSGNTIAQEVRLRSAVGARVWNGKGGRVGWAGFQLRGVNTALWLDPPLPPKKGSIDGPQSPTETDPGALEVTSTQNSAKK